MNTGRSLTTKQSFFVILMIAAFFALSANFGSMVLDQVAGTQINSVVHACAAQGGGC